MIVDSSSTRSNTPDRPQLAVVVEASAVPVTAATAAIDAGGSPAEIPPTVATVVVGNDSNSPSSSSIDDKRFRRFSVAQRKVLEFHFANGDYWPSKSMREKLSCALRVPQRKIQIWFQNQRAKCKDMLANQPSASNSLSEEAEQVIVQRDIELLRVLESQPPESATSTSHRANHSVVAAKPVSSSALPPVHGMMPEAAPSYPVYYHQPPYPAYLPYHQVPFNVPPPSHVVYPPQQVQYQEEPQENCAFSRSDSRGQELESSDSCAGKVVDSSTVYSEAPTPGPVFVHYSPYQQQSYPPQNYYSPPPYTSGTSNVHYVMPCYAPPYDVPPQHHPSAMTPAQQHVAYTTAEHQHVAGYHHHQQQEQVIVQQHGGHPHHLATSSQYPEGIPQVEPGQVG